ncbi:hypothetical protein [Mycobacterium sp. M26]|uniref:hypothetical protein n=1 Tax=Mycobacterium sp. M26 TaxID=1762962 RepID=UPI00073FA49B|nr:hypothetical protein [Mycobacterium sp. M26]
MTGVALASAAAVVAAVPAIVPSNDVMVASSSPAPLALSTAKYELTSITEVTLQGINDAYWFGWGGFLGPDSPYYQADNDIFISGLSGVLYYVIDCATSDTCTSDEGSTGLTLDNYYFEAGGIPAVIDVAVNEVFGEGSVPGLLADTIFKYGVTNVVNSLIYSAAQALPEISLGPITIGGGILAGLYFYGATPDGSFDYGTPGLSAVLSYIVTSISDALPSAAATSAAAKSAEVSTLAATTTETATTGDTKSEETTTEAATATEAAPKATGGFKKETEETTAAAATATEAAATETEAATEETSTETETATDTSTDTTEASTGTLPKATPTVKAPKTAKSENPLAKIGQKISDALSGKKADKSDSGSSSDSGSGGSGASGGSAKG